MVEDSAGPQFLRLAQNDIGEKCFASPAINHGPIFLRGECSLFCIGARSYLALRG